MVTNLEWLWENDRKTLIDMVAGDCDSCRFDENCILDCKCNRMWLEAEYVEPDSWEKIVDDAAVNAMFYCKDRNIKDDFGSYEYYMRLDLINRCKALAEEEKAVAEEESKPLIPTNIPNMGVCLAY